MENRNLTNAFPKTPYISLMSDFGFKRLMGTEKDKGPLLDLLNAVLKGERRIETLQLCNTTRPGRVSSSRTQIFDLLCTDETDARFIVEMQKAQFPFFKDRCLFYSAGAIIEQEVKGEWDYKLLPVYTICFQNFSFGDESGTDYLHPIALTYLKTGTPFSDRLKLFFLELHRFGSITEVPEDRLGQWCYLLKKMESLTEIPAALKDDPVFVEVFRRAALANLTSEEMKWYSQRRKERNDAYSLKLAYKAEGLAEGLAEGKTEGEAKGILKGKVVGIAEGKKLGEQKAKREIARFMKQENCSFTLIAAATGLPINVIEKL